MMPQRSPGRTRQGDAIQHHLHLLAPAMADGEGFMDVFQKQIVHRALPFQLSRQRYHSTVVLVSSRSEFITIVRAWRRHTGCGVTGN